MMQILKKISSALILLIGLSASIIGIYVFVIDDSNVKVDIYSSTDVIDLNADISNLNIFYDKVNLRQENKKLKLILINFQNNGNQNILKEFYDEKDLFGLELSTGIVVEKPSIVYASNEYLLKNLNIKQENDRKILLEPIILDKNASFRMKLLVLVNQDENPEIRVVGKIAGIENTNTPIPAYKVKKEGLGFFQSVFSGNIIVQLMRLIVCTVVMFFGIFVLIAWSNFKNSIVQKNRLTKEVKKFQSSTRYSPSVWYETIFKLHNNGVGLEGIQHSLKRKKYDHDGERLIRYGFLEKRSGKTFVNKPLEGALNNFVDFLRTEEDSSK